MLAGLYTAGTAMESAARHHEVIAQNLAHAQIPGYRRLSIWHTSFENQLQEASGQSQGTDGSQIAIDFTPGAMERTGHTFDVALQGNGFFAVEGPEGPLYTRSGNFQLDGEGRLVNPDGLAVLSSGGDIKFPPGANYESIKISPRGDISANGAPVGKLKIVKFSDPQLLRPAGATLFAAPPEIPEEESTALTIQGSLERANVSPIQELVEMIDAQRRHEAAQQSMKLLSEAVSNHVNASARG